MASSPDSSNPGSRTPPNPTSELSPPGSQTTQRTTAPTTATTPRKSGLSVSGMGMGRTAIPTSQIQSQDQGQGQGQRGQNTGQGLVKPGESWMNKRAEEEYQRAMEYVIDKDFSLKEFGDPFDQRDMEEKLP